MYICITLRGNVLLKVLNIVNPLCNHNVEVVMTPILQGVRLQHWIAK